MLFESENKRHKFSSNEFRFVKERVLSSALPRKWQNCWCSTLIASNLLHIKSVVRAKKQNLKWMGAMASWLSEKFYQWKICCVSRKAPWHTYKLNFGEFCRSTQKRQNVNGKSSTILFRSLCIANLILRKITNTKEAAENTNKEGEKWDLKNFNRVILVTQEIMRRGFRIMRRGSKEIRFLFGKAGKSRMLYNDTKQVNLMR